MENQPTLPDGNLYAQMRITRFADPLDNPIRKYAHAIADTGAPYPIEDLKQTAAKYRDELLLRLINDAQEYPYGDTSMHNELIRAVLGIFDSVIGNRISKRLADELLAQHPHMQPDVRAKKKRQDRKKRKQEEWKEGLDADP